MISNRTKNYFVQVSASVAYKGLAIFCSFLSIPITLKSLGPEVFGVWSTLFSLITWLVFFDVGLGNGLKNKVAELLSSGNYKVAQHYIASSYTFFGLISVVLFVILFFASFAIPWQKVFNTVAIPSDELTITVGIVLLFMIVNFWIGLVNSIITADQKSSLVPLGQFLSNLLFLISVYSLNFSGLISLSHVSYAFGFSQLTSNLLITFTYYKSKPSLCPYFSCDFSYVHKLLKTSLSFFGIQIAMLILFASDKIMIAQLFGPNEVAGYDLIYKIFSILIFSHGLLLTPLWPAFTNAYCKNDMDWILSAIKKQLLILLAMMAVVVVLIIKLDLIIENWIGGGSVDLNPKLVYAIAIFVLLTSWNNIFATFLNSIGDLKLQYIIAILASMLNIPISIGLAKYSNLGVSSVVYGSIISQLAAAILLPLQTSRKLMELARKNKILAV